MKQRIELIILSGFLMLFALPSQAVITVQTPSVSGSKSMRVLGTCSNVASEDGQYDISNQFAQNVLAVLGENFGIFLGGLEANVGGYNPAKERIHSMAPRTIARQMRENVVQSMRTIADACDLSKALACVDTQDCLDKMGQYKQVVSTAKCFVETDYGSAFMAYGELLKSLKQPGVLNPSAASIAEADGLLWIRETNIFEAARLLREALKLATNSVRLPQILTYFNCESSIEKSPQVQTLCKVAFATVKKTGCDNLGADAASLTSVELLNLLFPAKDDDPQFDWSDYTPAYPAP